MTPRPKTKLQHHQCSVTGRLELRTPRMFDRGEGRGWASILEWCGRCGGWFRRQYSKKVSRKLRRQARGFVPKRKAVS